MRTKYFGNSIGLEDDALSERPLHIYVAGPYSGITKTRVEQNVATAIKVGVEVIRKGHYPYIPHLTHFVDRVEGKSLTLLWDDHLDWGLSWLDRSDALLYIGGSRGADIELEYALKRGKMVFRSIEEVPSLGSRRYYVRQLKVDEPGAK